MMIIKAKAAIDKYNMLPKGSTVVAAVSGGSDSMALLAVLNSVKDEYSITLEAAHVNHGLRGEQANRDERFVAESCKKMRVKLHTLRADVAAEAAERGVGIEECGRQIRYEFFNSIGENVIIATAHNLSDRVETFLFNFARGSSLRGLCSIPPVRDNVVRPIIDCTKDEILTFCAENAIDYVTDETNSDINYSRNRIRHRVVPEIREINPAFERCAARCISSINEDEKFLMSLASELAKRAEKGGGIFSARELAEAPLPIKRRAIAAITEGCSGVTPEYRFIDEICALLESSGSIQINGGVTVRVRKGELDFPIAGSKPDSVEIKEGTVDFAGVSMEISIINTNEINNLQNISKQDLEYHLDCDRIVGKAFARSREPGDKLTLKARNCSKTLKKLFNELEIPPEKRNETVVIADECGVIFVQGAGCDRRVEVTDKTERIMVLRIIKN